MDGVQTEKIFAGPAGTGKKMFTNPPAEGIVMAKELVGMEKFNPRWEVLK